MRLPGSGPGWINWEFFGGSGEFFLGGSERALLPRESRDCSGIFSGIVPEFPSRDNPRKVFFFSFLHPWMDEPRGFQRFQILGIGEGEAAEPGDAAGFGVRRMENGNSGNSAPNSREKSRSHRRVRLPNPLGKKEFSWEPGKGKEPAWNWGPRKMIGNFVTPRVGNGWKREREEWEKFPRLCWESGG